MCGKRLRERGRLSARSSGLIYFAGMHTIAAQLLGSGACINDTMSDGQTLLHMAMQRQDSKSALFLLEHQADINIRWAGAALRHTPAHG